MTRRGQLAVILLLLAAALALALADGLRSRVTVRAQDGTEMVIHLDPDDVTDWSGRVGDVGPEAAPADGDSTQDDGPVPAGGRNEANMAGTAVR